MHKTIAELINGQITKEFHSAWLYLSISSYFEESGLDGFAAWYKKQALEEQEHAMKFYDYLHDCGEKVFFTSIEKPDNSFSDILSALRASAKHESFITSSINKIYAEAEKCEDYTTREFLSWFIKEQAEEEKTARDLLSKAELFADDKTSLYLMNKDMADRQ